MRREQTYFDLLTNYFKFCYPINRTTGWSGCGLKWGNYSVGHQKSGGGPFQPGRRMTIETKEASPPGGAESECLPPSKVSGKRPYLTKRSKPRVKKAQIARQLISDCCSSAEIKDFESISTTSAAGMMNGRIPLNDLIVVPESCMILEMFENASSTEDKSTSSGSNSAIGTQSQESSPIVASSRKRGTKRAKVSNI